MDSESGVPPYSPTSQPFLAQNLFLAPIPFTGLSTVLLWRTRLCTIWPLHFPHFPSPSVPFSQLTFCPSNVPSKFLFLCTCCCPMWAAPPSALHLCRRHLHTPPQRDLLTLRGPHRYPPSWMSFLLYFSTAHSPNTVCRLPPQCFLRYLFLFLPLSAEDRIQGLALSKHSATKPHPQALRCCPLSLPLSLVTFPGTSTPGFCPAFLMPLAPQLRVPSFCPLHTAPSTQERPNVTLQK